jgi:hypothetical protein
LKAATSIRTPRVNSAPTLWMPNFLKPLRSVFSSTFWQLYQLLRWVWCAKPSNCVPTWPSSVHDLFVRGAHVGELVHEGALGVHVEAPRSEERHAGAEHVREFDHRRGLLMIARAALVGRASFRRTALAFLRNGPGRGLREGGGGKYKRDRRTQCECFHPILPSEGALETAPLRQ